MASLIGEAVTETSTSRPSLVCRSVSKGSTCSPRLIFSRICFSSSCLSAGSSRMIEVPTISLAVWPNSFSAPLFQLVMMLFKSLPTMASPEDSIIDASRIKAVSARLRSVMSCWMTTKCVMFPLALRMGAMCNSTLNSVPSLR